MPVLQLRGLNLDQRNKMGRDKTWQFFRELGLIDGNTLLDRNYNGIHGAWQDQPAYVIGSGKSLAATLAAVGGWDFFNGKHTIGINHTIEDYDGFEWFFFLDKRFLDRTTYDITKYKGMIFAQCTTGMKPDYNIKIFFCRPGQPSTKIQDGLYNSNLSGIAALNLALLTGANPIYMCGMDTGKDGGTPAGYHYKKDYNGESKTQKVFDKFTRVMKQFDAFKAYKDRLRLVTDGGDQMAWVPRVHPSAIVKTSYRCVKVLPRAAKIVHLSFSPDINVHADITRHIVNECIGTHHLVDVNKSIPDADLYIGEHFLSTTRAINAMTPTQKAKTIDIVHTVNCIPQGNFLRVVALTNAWRRWLDAHLVKVTDTLIPGIDLEPYKNITPDYDFRVFGRMTRWSPGKVHPEWNRITLEILAAVPGSRCKIYTDSPPVAQRPFLKHPAVTYDHGCRINMFKGDYLKNLSVYVHANGSFKETLSFAVIEAMATGLPVVYLDEGTGVLDEVVAGCGVKCENINKVRDVVIEMLKDEEYRREYGAMAKVQSIYFGKQHMVADWNEVITKCLT